MMVYAYTFEEGALNLRLEHYEIDGEGGDVPTGSKQLDLEIWSGADWKEIELTGTVEIPSGLHERVFPDDEHPDPPSRLVVVVECPDTHHRVGVERIAEPQAGECEWTTTLNKQDIYGVVELRPFLVRTDPGEAHGYAKVVGQKVANGRPFTIEFDEVSTPGEKFMDVSFESFEELGLPVENLYHLKRPEAKVLVNDDHKLISKVLESGGHSGFRPLLRESIATWIAKDVKTELILWAITGIEGGEFDEDWQRGILETHGPQLYDFLDADSPKDLYALYRGEEGDDPHYLINTIEKVLQEDTNITDPMTNFIERHGPDYLSGGD